MTKIWKNKHLVLFSFYELVCWALPNCLYYSHTECICPFGHVVDNHGRCSTKGPQFAIPGRSHKDNPVTLSPPLSLFVSRLMTCLSQSVVGGVVLMVGDLAPFTKPLMQPISSTAVNKTYWKVNAETTQLRCQDWVLSICNVAFAILSLEFLSTSLL